MKQISKSLFLCILAFAVFPANAVVNNASVSYMEGLDCSVVISNEDETDGKKEEDEEPECE